MNMSQSPQHQSTTWPLALLLLGLLLSACGGAAAATELPPASFTQIPSASQTPSPSPSATVTPSPIPSDTPTPTITPTWSVLRGRVTVERLSCRFGPGAMYLYKYGMLERAAVNIIGRTDSGAWVLTEPPGGANRCWVNASLLEIEGNVLAVEPVDVHSVLAWSPYYDALTGIISYREGDVVTVSWDPLVLIAGDDSEQVPYVLEAWVCVDGEITFTPIGSYTTQAQVSDEAGCSEPSYGRVLAAEKHGYTPWVEVDWPAYTEEASPTP